MEDLHELEVASELKLVSLHADDEYAMAVTTDVAVVDQKYDGGRKEGPLVITLVKRDNVWLVTDIDIETEATAKDELDRFFENHPNAVEISPEQSSRTPAPTSKGDDKDAVQVDGAKISEKDELAWGKAVDGVQCRLRADKLIGQEGQLPTFEADIRNGGSARLRVVPTHQRCTLILDRKRYNWPTWEYLVLQAFGPGCVYRDILIPLVKTWAGGMPLELNPGRHEVSVSFQCQGTGSQGETVVVIVESNTVEFEILPKEEPTVQVEGRNH
jgi:hypothetical protein